MRRGNKKKVYLYMIPYFAICIFSLVLPSAALAVNNFHSGLESIIRVLTTAFYMEGLRNSFLLALLTTIEASIIGAVIAIGWAEKAGKNGFLMAILNFGANNGGISLAFSLIATLGTNGFLTLIFQQIGITILDDFKLASFAGLNIVYISFLIPYMAIIFLPTAANIKPDWWKVAKTLGASRFQYLRKIEGPVLLPSFISCACLVFLTALGTYATAQAICADRIKLVTIQIGTLVQTSVFKKEDAYTLAFVLMIIMFFVVILYQRLNRKAGRWMK